MTVYVDDLIAYGQKSKPGGERYFGEGKQSCHMTTDGDAEELHAFASRLGLKRSWYQHHQSLPHYDLTPNKRAMAVRMGAVETTTYEMVMRALRYRQQKAKHGECTL